MQQVIIRIAYSPEGPAQYVSAYRPRSSAIPKFEISESRVAAKPFVVGSDELASLQLDIRSVYKAPYTMVPVTRTGEPLSDDTLEIPTLSNHAPVPKEPTPGDSIYVRDLEGAVRAMIREMDLCVLDDVRRALVACKEIAGDQGRDMSTRRCAVKMGTLLRVLAKEF